MKRSYHSGEKKLAAIWLIEHVKDNRQEFIDLINDINTGEEEVPREILNIPIFPDNLSKEGRIKSLLLNLHYLIMDKLGPSNFFVQELAMLRLRKRLRVTGPELVREDITKLLSFYKTIGYDGLSTNCALSLIRSLYEEEIGEIFSLVNEDTTI